MKKWEKQFRVFYTGGYFIDIYLYYDSDEESEDYSDFYDNITNSKGLDRLEEKGFIKLILNDIVEVNYINLENAMCMTPHYDNSPEHKDLLPK